MSVADWRPHPCCPHKAKSFEECLAELDKLFPDMEATERICQATYLYHLYHRTLESEAGIRDINGPLS